MIENVEPGRGMFLPTCRFRSEATFCPGEKCSRREFFSLGEPARGGEKTFENLLKNREH
jgi:hypothetical protein